MEDSFHSLGINAEFKSQLESAGFQSPTPIQCEVIPSVLAGSDVLAIAETGSGKTAAFLLPLVQRLAENPIPRRARPWVRLLVLAPTRELVSQIHSCCKQFSKSMKLRSAELIGGVSIHPQIRSLEKGIDIAVATPGRLQDLLDRRELDLRDVEYFVLDEADMMLDMGFLPAVEQIAKQLPSDRQTLMFSATMPPAARQLAERLLRTPQQIQLADAGTIPATITQMALEVPVEEKVDALHDWIQQWPDVSGLIFCRTRRTVDQVGRSIKQLNRNVSVLHGDKSQSYRQRIMRQFRCGEITILVASDLASRGLDVTEVDCVMNFDMPDQLETYTHRVGRVGRAGNAGTAITFVTPEQVERFEHISLQLKAPIDWLRYRSEEHDFVPR